MPLFFKNASCRHNLRITFLTRAGARTRAFKSCTNVEIISLSTVIRCGIKCFPGIRLHLITLYWSHFAFFIFFLSPCRHFRFQRYKEAGIRLWYNSFQWVRPQRGRKRPYIYTRGGGRASIFCSYSSGFTTTNEKGCLIKGETVWNVKKKNHDHKTERKSCSNNL